MPRTPNSKEVLDRALCLAVGEYVKGTIRLEGKPVYQTPRIVSVVAVAVEELVDESTYFHLIEIGT